MKKLILVLIGMSICASAYATTIISKVGDSTIVNESNKTTVCTKIGDTIVCN